MIEQKIMITTRERIQWTIEIYKSKTVPRVAIIFYT